MKFKEFHEIAVTKRQEDRFQEPTIHRPSDGKWFVGYRYRLPAGPWSSTFKEFSNLEAYTNIEQKEKEAELLRQDVLAWLEAGNSPYGS